jgi:hypothetical protein
MPATSWFEEAFGFEERSCGSFEGVREQFSFNATTYTLTSITNGVDFHVGLFETPSIATLRRLVGEARAARGEALGDRMGGSGSDEASGGLLFHNIIGDVTALTLDPANAGAVIQVASQFNCLEMTSKTQTHEKYLPARTNTLKRES